VADVYTVLSLWRDLAPDQTYPRAKAAAQEALRLDSSLASPYAALGDINAMYEWNWVEPERNFRRSLALDPNNANTRHWYADDFLLAVGRMEEALEQSRRARELDPLSALLTASVGNASYRTGQAWGIRSRPLLGSIPPRRSTIRCWCTTSSANP
jgi:tetratricopeptide (TPR) repeat protein